MWTGSGVGVCQSVSGGGGGGEEDGSEGAGGMGVGGGAGGVWGGVSPHSRPELSWAALTYEPVTKGAPA